MKEEACLALITRLLRALPGSAQIDPEGWAWNELSPEAQKEVNKVQAEAIQYLGRIERTPTMKAKMPPKKMPMKPMMPKGKVKKAAY